MKKENGFTLLELMLVVVVIGLMLAVIVPRAWRANVDAKYGLVRQAASELAAFGHEWTEQMIVAQPEEAASKAYNYYRSLVGASLGGGVGMQAAWVADPDVNWTGPGAKDLAPIQIWNRHDSTFIPLPPECPVRGVVPPEKHPRNPFNGASYFVAGANLPTGSGVIPGALACACVEDPSRPGGWHYFALMFQGTDSTTTNIDTSNTTTFHAGQSLTLPGLRNGTFFARAN